MKMPNCRRSKRTGEWICECSLCALLWIVYGEGLSKLMKEQGKNSTVIAFKKAMKNELIAIRKHEQSSARFFNKLMKGKR